jgi:hypothetical protein
MGQGNGLCLLNRSVVLLCSKGCTLCMLVYMWWVLLSAYIGRVRANDGSDVVCATVYCVPSHLIQSTQKRTKSKCILIWGVRIGQSAIIVSGLLECKCQQKCWIAANLKFDMSIHTLVDCRPERGGKNVIFSDIRCFLIGKRHPMACCIEVHRPRLGLLSC